MPSIDEMVASQQEGSVAAEVDHGQGTTRVVLPMREAHSADPVKPEAKPEATPATKAVEPMPEDGVDKYYNAETGAYDWKSHAKEAEFKAKMAKGKAKKPEAAPEGEEAREVVAAAGLDFDTLGEKLNVQGDIDPDDYEALAKIGIPEHVVQAHIAGLKALQETTTQAVLAKAGGQENLNRLMKWAGTNLQPFEITAYNKMLAGPEWPIALDMLKARAEGYMPPKMVRPGSSAPPETEGFQSQEEFMAAIRDPRYAKSADYRQQVVNKLAKMQRGPAKGRVRIG